MYWVETSNNTDTAWNNIGMFTQEQIHPLIATAKMKRAKKKQVEEICGIPSEIASLMDSLSCQLIDEK